MSHYITQSDLEKRLSQRRVIELTADEGEQSANTENLNAVIDQSEGEADGYIGSRYPVPLDPVPPVVKAFVLDIAVYRLKGRRQGVEEGSDAHRRYQDALKFFEKISKGIISLGANTPAPKTTSHTVKISSSARIFTDKTLEGF